MAAEGYPSEPIIGDVIHGLDMPTGPNFQVFHGKTILENGEAKTDGGRVLNPTQYAENSPTARKKLNSRIGENGIRFKGMQVRYDVGL